MTRNEQRRLTILAEAEAFGVPGHLTPTWRKHYAKGAFTKGQRVAVAFDTQETATVIDGKPVSVSPTSGDWYAVRFADGGSLSVHENRLRAA